MLDEVRGWGETAIEMLPNLAVAVAVLVVFGLLARLAQRLVRPGLRKISHNEQLQGLGVAAARVAVLCLGLFIALSILELDGTVASLLAGVGVIGLALGFAFQDIAANFMSGIILASRQPFKAGDTVEIGSFNGTIEHLDLRATVGRTFQGQLVTMPNKDVLGSHIKNFTTTGEWRVEVAVGVSYGDDLDAAEDAVRHALEAVEVRDANKPVDVWFVGFGDSSIDMSARVWVDMKAGQSFLVARHQVIKSLKRTLDDRGITIPFPIRTLDFGAKGGEGLNAALEPAIDRAMHGMKNAS